jgi:hypothetical protein
VLLPLILLAAATLSAAVVAYGTHPTWAQYAHGVSFIVFSRAWQWPLTALAILLCLSAVALVVAGRRRAWWLIGLAPVLALFVHRFHSDPFRAFRIVDGPPMMQAAQASFLSDEDWVVGVRLADAEFAIPYAQLFATPVIVLPEHDKRLLLLWSPFANRALAHDISRDLHARDLEIVSMPANALLVYNRRLGQFINGVSGRTSNGEKPAGFGRQLATEKMPWGQWKRLHPSTRVAGPLPRGAQQAPSRPLLPYYPTAVVDQGASPLTRIAVVASTPPLAVPEDAIKSIEPLNISAASGPLLVFRDPAGRVRAYERRLDDLAPRFKLNTSPRRKPAAVFMDADTGSAWDIDGRALEGEMARSGRRLKAVLVEEQLYWSVMKFHLPDLSLSGADGR